MFRCALSTVTLFILLPFTGKGQSFDLGSWNILHLKYNYDNQWSGMLLYLTRTVVIQLLLTPDTLDNEVI